MEDEKSFSDICGGHLSLRRRYYSPYCREFGLSSARLSLRSLTAVTCAVWLAAYGLFTLCEVKAGARLSRAFGGERSWGRPVARLGTSGSGTPSRPAAGLSSPNKFCSGMLYHSGQLPYSATEHTPFSSITPPRVPVPTDSKHIIEFQTGAFVS